MLLRQALIGLASMLGWRVSVFNRFCEKFSGDGMSPILLRPIREQLEHDRIIRQLQARWRRRHAVAINIGSQQTTSVHSGNKNLFPDLVLTSTEGGNRPQIIIEVETAESINTLEAMSQWVYFSRVRCPFYLYVPVGLADTARRLCAENKIKVNEIWTYYSVGTQARFSMFYRSPETVQAIKNKTRKDASKAKASKNQRVRKGKSASKRASVASKKKSSVKAKRVVKQKSKTKKTKIKIASKKK